MKWVIAGVVTCGIQYFYVARICKRKHKSLCGGLLILYKISSFYVLKCEIGKSILIQAVLAGGCIGGAVEQVLVLLGNG